MFPRPVEFLWHRSGCWDTQFIKNCCQISAFFKGLDGKSGFCQGKLWCNFCLMGNADFCEELEKMQSPQSRGSFRRVFLCYWTRCLMKSHSWNRKGFSKKIQVFAVDWNSIKWKIQPSGTWREKRRFEIFHEFVRWKGRFGKGHPWRKRFVKRHSKRAKIQKRRFVIQKAGKFKKCDPDPVTAVWLTTVKPPHTYQSTTVNLSEINSMTPWSLEPSSKNTQVSAYITSLTAQIPSGAKPEVLSTSGIFHRIYRHRRFLLILRYLFVYSASGIGNESSIRVQR